MNVDLNALVREPGRVQTLPTAEARDVLPQLAALVVSLAVRASQEAPTDGAKPELLNADQVLAQFGLPAGCWPTIAASSSRRASWCGPATSSTSTR
jgi:hypothetical protein